MVTQLIHVFVILCFIVNAVLFAVVVCEVIKWTVHRWRYRYKFCMWLHKFFKENEAQLEFDFEMMEKQKEN